MQKANTFLREHAQGVTRGKKLASDLWEIFEGMVDVGWNVIYGNETEDRYKASAAFDKAYAQYLDSIGKNRGFIGGNKPMTREQFRNSKLWRNR